MLKAVEVKQHFFMQPLASSKHGEGSVDICVFLVRAPSCRCLMLWAALLEPVGLLVGWDQGRRTLQWRGSAAHARHASPLAREA